MSGDAQPKKRKNKGRKKGSLEARRIEEYAEESTIFRKTTPSKDEVNEDLLPPSSKGSSDEVIHVHKDIGLGGNVCTKLIFFCLLGALGVMVGFIMLEYRGSTDEDTRSAVDSPWSVMLENWVEELPDDHGHDDHHMAHSGEEEEEELDHDDHGGGSEEAHEEEEEEEEEHGEEEEEHEVEGSPEDDDKQSWFSFLSLYGYDSPPEEEPEAHSEEQEEEEEEKHTEEEEEEEEEEEDEHQPPHRISIHDEEEEEEEEDEKPYKARFRRFRHHDDEEEEENKRKKRALSEEEEEEEEEEASKEQEEEEEEGTESGVEEDEDDDDMFPEAIAALKREKAEKASRWSFRSSREEPKKHTEEVEEEEEEQNDAEEEVEGTSGIGLKFGVGVALVVVAHVVLVKKWNTGEGAESQAEKEVAEEALSSIEDEPIPTAVPIQTMPEVVPEPSKGVESKPDNSRGGGEEEYEAEEEEEEEEEEIEEPIRQREVESEILKKNYERLLAQYGQPTPESSDAEQSEDEVPQPTQHKAPVTYQAEESPAEEEESEPEEEEAEPPKWTPIKKVEVATESEEEEEEESEDEAPPVVVARRTTGGPRSADDYENTPITNQYDWEIRDGLDRADEDLENLGIYF